MFEVGIVGQFEAAHRLRGDFGPATRLHGHTYRVEVAVRGGSLRDDGTLLDIGVLQQALQEALAELHYRDLDELAVFRGRNTTAEAVAQHLFKQVAVRLRKAGGGGTDAERGVATPVSLSVRVWESPGAWASYEDAID